ncbi:DUF167 domain-containing protein [Aquiluna borgnonia]|uniref:UPF0235 protein HRU87_02945 n=1 Tax=Aquiluna borgnonia TaxID=2499157 RepID=A0A7D4Q4L4_9MICO|nr:DUF167 domain-containing protein [Aquiluna borgnonia]QKJ25163.1 DUF167 domain-containing protein [Aquiluna borgnonia]
MRLKVRVKPGSKSGDRVVPGAEYLDVFLREKPVDGKANEALVRILAGYFDVPRESVRIVTGASARIKTVEIEKPAEAG